MKGRKLGKRTLYFVWGRSPRPTQAAHNLEKLAAQAPPSPKPKPAEGAVASMASFVCSSPIRVWLGHPGWFLMLIMGTG